MRPERGERLKRKPKGPLLPGYEEEAGSLGLGCSRLPRLLLPGCYLINDSSDTEHSRSLLANFLANVTELSKAGL